VQQETRLVAAMMSIIPEASAFDTKRTKSAQGGYSCRNEVIKGRGGGVPALVLFSLHLRCEIRCVTTCFKFTQASAASKFKTCLPQQFDGILGVVPCGWGTYLR
jgi:hypothetical protein